MSTSQPQVLSFPLFYTERVISCLPASVVRHGAVASIFLALALVVGWPMLGGDFPPGVDTPTFLHLSWVTQQAVLGNLDKPFTDQYWYGGFPYLQAYSPLSYGMVGLVSAVTWLDLPTVYRIALVMAFIGLGLASYWLALEMGLRWWAAAMAGALTMMAYPVLAASFYWGWFSSLVALPIVIVSYILLERSLRTQRVWVAALGGLFLALAVLTHHMTAFALALGLVAWALFHLMARTYPLVRLARFSAAYVGVGIIVSLPWAIPFLIYWSDVGFERPVPGNWAFSLGEYREALLSSGRIGSFFYPSYFGTVLVPLGVMGAVYALLTSRRLAGAAVILMVLLWFSLGAKGNVLYYYTPFRSLDVARFHLYAVPFMALAVAFLVNGLFNLLREKWPRLGQPLLSSGLAALVVVAVMAYPLMDAWKARGLVEPYRIEPDVQNALNWISRQPVATSAQDERIFTLGFWTWGSFLVPYETQRPLADGWYDEGARNWETVQRLRLMAFNADVDALAAHQALTELGAKYVLVYDWYPYQHPWLFQEAFQDHPSLFDKQAEWGEGPRGRIMAFEVLSS